MRKSVVRFAGVCTVSAALTLSAAACGSGNKSAACTKLQKSIADISRKGLTQVSDPNGLAATYSSGANSVRQEGKDSGDGKVEKAANDVASALDSLGQQVKSISSSGSTIPQMPDTAPLTNAGVELKSACDG